MQIQTRSLPWLIYHHNLPPCLHLWGQPPAALKNKTVSIQKRQWQPIPVPLPPKSHGQRSLVGCSPWGRCESGTTEQLHFHFSLSCIGEGNGNPLQCSCLENPKDGGAWWAAIYGVTQSWTRLKRLSSNSIQWKCSWWVGYPPPHRDSENQNPSGAFVNS